MISIHAPRAGSDVNEVAAARQEVIFQSTLPVRGATRRRSACPGHWLYFNPRSPCGERHARHQRKRPRLLISIHAPRAGSDER